MKRLALIFCLVIIVYPFLCYSKSIEIIGTIVALKLNLEGHSYSEYKMAEIPKSYLIVRIDELVKSTEESKYVLVSFIGDRGESDFGNPNSFWKFKLTRNKACDANLRDLQFAFFGRKQTSGVLPRLLRTPGYENEALPFDSKLSCYATNLKNTQEIRKANADSKRVEAEYDSFVLEKALWLNPTETPLKVYFGRLDEVANTTDKPISEFKFGCVSFQDNAYQIKHSFEVEKVKVPAKKRAYLAVSNGNSEYMDELYTCYQMKSKVAVVWVKFEDNSLWKLK